MAFSASPRLGSSRNKITRITPMAPSIGVAWELIRSYRHLLTNSVINSLSIPMPKIQMRQQEIHQQESLIRLKKEEKVNSLFQRAEKAYHLPTGMAK